MVDQDGMDSRSTLIIHIMMFLFGALFAWGLTSKWSEAPPMSADWGNVADWAAAFGSVGAVITALWISNQATRQERDRVRREEARVRAVAVSRAIAIDHELWMLIGEIEEQLKMIKLAMVGRQYVAAVKGVLSTLPSQPLPMLSKLADDPRGLDVNDAATLMLALSAWDQVANPDRYARFESSYGENEAFGLLGSWKLGFRHLLRHLGNARHVTQRLMLESSFQSQPVGKES